jgi:hypothetical protein
MKTDIPKEILDRCTFKDLGSKGDPIKKIHKIVPEDPCPCGKVLDNIRRVRITQTKEPHPHWREYCHTCKLVSFRGENVWYTARELNDLMRGNLVKPPKTAIIKSTTT